jgi:hypothetical protein
METVNETTPSRPEAFPSRPRLRLNLRSPRVARCRDQRAGKPAPVPALALAHSQRAPQPNEPADGGAAVGQGV